MVQRNASKKPLPSHDQQQESRSKGGGGDSKMRKLMSIKITDFELDHVQLRQPLMVQKNSSGSRRSQRLPNYMKPTSSSDAKKEQNTRSSDARKEQLKVNQHHLTTSTDRKTGQRNLNNLNNSKPSSASHIVSRLKPARILNRKPSFKTVKLAIKKNLGTPPCPDLGLNRETCSSTLKDSKFPKALDLNPGATEAEGTSVMKVCPYKYCSLNGHWHEPLPPLKCFLSSRRKLIKAQKSMKLRGLPSFRKQGSGKGGKEIDTGQAVIRTRSGLQITSLIEEITEDFFVEIYTKPQGQKIESVKLDEVSPQENPEILNSSNQTEDDMKSSNHVDNKRNLMDETHEGDSGIIFHDGIYQNSDISIGELEITLNFLEYVNCDQQDESEEKILHPAIEEFEEVNSECCAADRLVINNEALADISLEEDIDSYFDDESNSSVNSYDGFCPLPGDLGENMSSNSKFFVEPEITQVLVEMTDVTGEPSYEASKSIVDHGDITACSLGGPERDDMVSSDTNTEGTAVQVPSSCDDGVVDNNVLDDDTEAEDTENAEVEETISLSELELFSSNPEQIEADDNMKENVQVQIDIAEDVKSYFDKLFPSNYNKDSEEGCTSKPAAVFSKHALVEIDHNQNMKLIITKNTTMEELEQMKEFNPRAPHFLPLEPDPEAEKVDLRHQMTDERRNAEEWMIDYALRQTVTKLTPARRRKVALLVEAFETVKPLPICEKPSKHATQGFAQQRSMQACS